LITLFRNNTKAPQPVAEVLFFSGKEKAGMLYTPAFLLFRDQS
jgi:hypothetical protein